MRYFPKHVLAYNDCTSHQRQKQFEFILGAIYGAKKRIARSYLLIDGFRHSVFYLVRKAKDSRPFFSGLQTNLR